METNYKNGYSTHGARLTRGQRAHDVFEDLRIAAHCESPGVSHFAAFFVDTRAKQSITGGC